ncbi:MAG: 4-hydroxy-tetrahydrodipicolinate reductase, partial [Bacteroidota bacterium]
MKIALVGYGKMGRAIDAVATDAGHQIVAKIDHTSQLDSIVSLSPDVAIEFSQPEVAFDNIYFLVDNQIPVVTGTTGWLDKLPSIIDLVKEKQGTFLYASNFSIGV